jgi:hypothetical protein
LDDRRSELLDTQYFHVIFTVPQPIATIALQNKDVGPVAGLVGIEGGVVSVSTSNHRR